MYILFDLGKTKLRVAGTSNKKDLTDIVILKTPILLRDAIDLLVETALKISSGKITAFAGGLTAALDKSRGVMATSLIKEKVNGVKVYIHNDSSLGALGEAVYGAGKDKRVVQYFTVSTGIGGGKVVDEKIDLSFQGFEIGHQIIDYKNNQSLEDLASGKALEKKYNKPPKEIKDKEVWEELSSIVAVGVYNSILHFMPDIVVLGGSMITGDPAIPIESIEKHLRMINKILPTLPPLKMSELGDQNGIYGALAFLNQIGYR